MWTEGTTRTKTTSLESWDGMGARLYLTLANPHTHTRFLDYFFEAVLEVLIFAVSFLSFFLFGQCEVTSVIFLNFLSNDPLFFT